MNVITHISSFHFISIKDLSHISVGIRFGITFLVWRFVFHSREKILKESSTFFLFDASLNSEAISLKNALKYKGWLTRRRLSFPQENRGFLLHLFVFWYGCISMGETTPFSFVGWIFLAQKVMCLCWVEIRAFRGRFHCHWTHISLIVELLMWGIRLAYSSWFITTWEGLFLSWVFIE